MHREGLPMMARTAQAQKRAFASRVTSPQVSICGRQGEISKYDNVLQKYESKLRRINYQTSHFGIHLTIFCVMLLLKESLQ